MTGPPSDWSSPSQHGADDAYASKPLHCGYPAMAFIYGMFKPQLVSEDGSTRQLVWGQNSLPIEWVQYGFRVQIPYFGVPIGKADWSPDRGPLQAPLQYRAPWHIFAAGSLGPTATSRGLAGMIAITAAVVLLPVVGIVLALALAGGGDDQGFATDRSDESSDPDPDPSESPDTSSGSGELDGVSITVGSKDFTENILLGEMFVAALEGAGADVNDQVNLGGTEVNRSALISGDIDVYPEYNGTGWTVHLANDNPSSDSTRLTRQTGEADRAQNGVQWIGRSPFNDTYGFATSTRLANSEGPFDMQGMADYLRSNRNAKVCVDSEFPKRPDGLPLFEQATGYDVPNSQIEVTDFGEIYVDTERGSCAFGEIFTTDGRLAALDLELVEDPGVFIRYNISYTMRGEVFDENAAVYEDIGTTILDSLDDATMTELNARVDVQGQLPEEVAEDYLEEQGLL